MILIPPISAEETGKRIRIARESTGLSQGEAANIIDVARTTIVAIEKGERRVKIDELQKLAKAYGTTVNALLRKEAIFVDVMPRFRKIIDTSDSEIVEATIMLNDLARAEVELENLLGVLRVRNYPPERPILPGNVAAQAEQDAFELRQQLGLGFRPVLDMVPLLEMELGIRTYVRRLASKISGVFVHDPSLGACILLNANHPLERRNFSAAHELGHLVATRSEPEVQDIHSGVSNVIEERYANAFARSFLAPRRLMAERFERITAGSKIFSRRHVIALASSIGLSREATVKRLEELEIVNPGTWTTFEVTGGITAAQARQVMGKASVPDLALIDSAKPIAVRLRLLSYEALNQGLMSEGQLCQLLKTDRIEFREMMDEIEWQEADIDADNLPPD